MHPALYRSTTAFLTMQGLTPAGLGSVSRQRVCTEATPVSPGKRQDRWTERKEGVKKCWSKKPVNHHRHQLQQPSIAFQTFDTAIATISGKQAANARLNNDL